MSQPPNTRSCRSASGTTSLIFGERPSVRLPRRIVPIWVSEPIGDDSPFRMANTPAMVVVLTAPRPTSSTPSLPRAGAISTGVGTNENYISLQSPVASHQSHSLRSRLRLSDVSFNPFARRGDPHVLAVTMTCVKLRDRVAFVGAPVPARLAASAAKVGLSAQSDA